jgi:hypothetical protein
VRPGEREPGLAPSGGLQSAVLEPVGAQVGVAGGFEPGGVRCGSAAQDQQQVKSGSAQGGVGLGVPVLSLDS